MEVFISYKSTEAERAYLVCDILSQNGISTWMAPDSIPSGSNYTREIPRAITSCEIVVLILSNEAQKSQWVLAEIENAYKKKKTIIPFVIEELTLNEEFDFLLSRYQRIEAYNDSARALEQLVNCIKALVKDEEKTAEKDSHAEQHIIADSRIKRLWYCDSEDQWKNALSHYYDKMGTEQIMIENYINSIDAEYVKSLNAMEFYEFLYDKYYVWKYTQKNRLATTRKCLSKYLLNNELSKLENIKERLFAHPKDDIEGCLKTATEIYGLGTAGASGLLSILYPRFFGTVDQFVVGSLCKTNHPVYNETLNKMKPESLNNKDGVILITIMREKAEELNRKFNTDFWTPRKIDMILWSFDRQ